MAEQVREILGYVNWYLKWHDVREKLMSIITEDPACVDITKYNNWGYTSLCYALEHANLELITFLLDKGANPNYNVQNVHSSRPIFFAKSVNALKLLKERGADLTVWNTGCGFSSRMNLLHQSVNVNTANDEIFNYCLSLGMDPSDKTETGENLWHSLIAISLRYCSENCFTLRAQKLHQLGISPHERDERFNRSAAEEVEKDMLESTGEYKEKFRKFLEIMNTNMN